jgi:hypothetical protein
MENRKMTEVAGIIADLTAYKAALDKALAALREIDDETPPAWVTSGSTAATSPAKRKYTRSAEARRRMAESQRKRWAAKKAGK